jgi:serine/threonine protein phosphatase 1
MRNSARKGPRIFAVGDIHGYYGKLADLLDRLPYDPAEDVLVFMGDYIDRGPQSREVVARLLELRRECGNAVFLMGNHEHALLEYARTGDTEYLRLLRRIGVEATLKSYGDSSVMTLADLSFLPDDHRGFLEDLLPYYEMGGYLFVHAGVPPGRELSECSPEELLTVRHAFVDGCTSRDEVIVFGHTPFETPFVTPDKIGIDTGAAYGNLLTAVELPGLHFYHS